MNSKRIIIATLSLLLAALLLVGTVNVLIDPLFVYHKPWFGLEPNIINERYQNAGIARNFDFENAIIGNSMSQNFILSDAEKALDGKTVKLTAPGSHMLDWSYVLDVLSKRKKHPEKVLLNFDTGFILSSDKETMHKMPTYLYDDSYWNDVEYLFNFTLLNKYTYGSLKANKNNSVADYNTAFIWTQENDTGKEKVLAGYYKEKNKQVETEQNVEFFTEENLELLKKYVESMPDTQFVFFGAPFSVLYWNDIYECGQLDDYKIEFENAFRFMSQYDNITMYFWTDEEMLNIMSDLDNYKDSSHYGAHISKEILRRIDEEIGVLPKEEKAWKAALERYFTYLENFDYTTLFK